jgi:oligopeptidase B
VPAARSSAPLRPPDPPRRPTELNAHGDRRVDDWFWMRERNDPEVRAHLEAENAYTAAALAHTEALQRAIFEEIRSRVQETDESAPVPRGPWEYYSRTLEGLQYAIHCRRPRGGGAEQVLLDENREADGHEFFSLGVYDVSPDHRYLAYAVDLTGGEHHELRIRDLDSGADLEDRIADVTYGSAWADDSTTLFYVRPDDAMRPFQVWRHRLGTAAGDDVLVYEEDDERFFVAIERTRSGRYVLVESHSKTTSETWYVPTHAPGAELALVEPRDEGHEYTVEHHCSDGHDRFLVVTNSDGATNFRAVEVPVANPGREHWVEVIPHRPAVRLDGITAFEDFLVVSELEGGLDRLRVLRLGVGHEREVPVPDPVYSLGVGRNEEYATSTFRYAYTSLVAPPSDLDFDVERGTSVPVKQQPVPGYDASRYTSARLWAPAADGTRVPVSLVHRRDVALDGCAPALLYGYGAYETSIDPAFRAARLSLLDRGFVFAIAHVRGGGELGRPWYEQGRREHKPNTFGDFVACAEHLIEAGYTTPDRLVARGGSAGGLLMGAVVNLRPDLFAAVVAEVPFVDVLTTMQDESLPLTITEWDEWGDPADPDAYATIRGYSPYDNVEAKPYPAILATAALHDARVQYWEPAKWVAKLRASTTSDRPVLLRVELGAGHAGPSGRYDAWREEAFVLAFVCDAVGITA